jgi:hypothetical protein
LVNVSVPLIFCLIFLFLSLTLGIMSDDFEEDSEPPADDSEEEILASLVNDGEEEILASLGIHSTAEIHLEDLKKSLTQYASDRNFQATHPHH